MKGKEKKGMEGKELKNIVKSKLIGWGGKERKERRKKEKKEKDGKVSLLKISCIEQTLKFNVETSNAMCSVSTYQTQIYNFFRSR